ncbi:hypothetical protein LEN26_011655 [Aphanomyces euteiches]|nr:hypothetical protein LEN26_011655 [Aphanomyces euteiches]KAH9127980.1 hypothetical protein AeMF1_001785 [Aphanomyces euteiches]KAH9190613.1 hypothetical protein AeNC1_007410 [Aphanomyces euteiches]
MSKTDEDALMDEFDSVEEATAPPVSSSYIRRYPSLHSLTPQTTAAGASRQTPPVIPVLSTIPKYPSLNDFSSTTAMNAKQVPAPAVNVINVPSSDGIPMTQPLVGQVETNLGIAPKEQISNEIKASTTASTKPEEQRELTPEEMAQMERDVQQELASIQSVMNHIDMALRGETPHQIEQRELREKARHEREQERLKRKLALHEQQVQRLQARLSHSTTSLS